MDPNIAGSFKLVPALFVLILLVHIYSTKPEMTVFDKFLSVLFSVETSVDNFRKAAMWFQSVHAISPIVAEIGGDPVNRQIV